MAFESLKSRINKLPLVICGPILRKVDARSVSVWVALREKQNIALAVFSQKENGELDEIMRGNTETVKVGDKLHIALVTAKIDIDLQAGQLYYYNLFFSEDTVPTNRSRNLKKQSVIDFRIDYDYKDDASQSSNNTVKAAALKLPSFSLPPDDLGKLRIVHASCRKPHGGGEDAMPTIDRMIAGDWTQADKRPHLLFLTGDQIYADDVSPLLLFMLMDTSETLIGEGRKEQLPTVQLKNKITISKKSKDETGKDLIENNEEGAVWKGVLPLPDRRGQIMKEFGKFSESFGNHLMTFGEYCSMYLMVWSDVLWRELPEFEDIFKNAEKTIDLSPQLMKLEAQMFSNDFKTTVTTEVYERYKVHKSRLSKFKSKLKYIRRLLANVPSYMIFDDHEITDDWHMTLNWTEKVLSNKLGRRVIQNGMCAYSLFQAWGNTPDQFDLNQADLPGARLLNLIQSWNSQEGYFTNDESEIRRLLALPLLKTETSKVFGSTGEFVKFNTGAKKDMIKWHYRILGKGFEVIVFDGRTKRGYPNPKDPIVKSHHKYRHASIVHEDKIIDQVPKFKKDEPIPQLSFFIASTSLVEIPALDFDEYPLISEMIVKCMTKNDENLDVFDSWKNQSIPFENLLYYMSSRGLENVESINTTNIVLTGDVHFSGASKVNYENNRLSDDLDKTTCEAVFVQLISSSLKNQEWKTKLLHYEGYKFSSVASFYHWTDSVEDKPEYGIKFFANVALYVLNEAFTFLDQIDPVDFFEPKLPNPKNFLGWEADKSFKDIKHIKIAVPDTDTQLKMLETGVLPSQLPQEHKLVPVQPLVVLSKEDVSKVISPKLEKPGWRYHIEYILAEDEARLGFVADPLSVADFKIQTKDKALKAYLNAAKNHIDYAQKWGSGKEVVGLNNVSEIVLDLGDESQSIIQKTWWYLKQKNEDKEPELFPLTKYKVSLELEKDKLPQLPEKN